jgi:hypothetical protein
MKIAIRPSLLPENSLTLLRQNWRRTSVLRVSVNSQTDRAKNFSEKKMRKWIEISPATARQYRHKEEIFC